MDFNIDLIGYKVTKKFILSKISQESIFEYYLNVPINKKLVRSPLRSDGRPTCGFFKAGDTLYFHDFGTGDKYNCFDVVIKLYNVSYQKALDIIASDFNLSKKIMVNKKAENIKNKHVIFENKNRSIIQIQKQEFTKSELEWWNDFGISKEILNKFKVFSCKSIFLNGNIFAQSAQHCPIYGYYFGREGDLELWRIYFPKRKEFRFISNTSAKKIQGWKQLPEEGKLIVITKSMKDVMTLSSFGIPAIAPNSENLFVDDKRLNELKKRFKHIIVFYDNDLAGISNMRKIKQKYPELIYTWIPKKLGAKDISDLYKLCKRQKTLKILKNFITWLKEEKLR